MSGDVDTSFGNSLINYYILISLLKELNVVGDAIVNGDDFIIFTTRKCTSNPKVLLPWKLNNAIVFKNYWNYKTCQSGEPGIGPTTLTRKTHFRRFF
jgi:hypothetical protein